MHPIISQALNGFRPGDFRFDGGPINPPDPVFDAEKAISAIDSSFEEIIGDLDRIRLDHGIEARDLMAEMEYLQKAIYRRLRGE